LSPFGDKYKGNPDICKEFVFFFLKIFFVDFLDIFLK